MVTTKQGDRESGVTGEQGSRVAGNGMKGEQENRVPWERGGREQGGRELGWQWSRVTGAG